MMDRIKAAMWALGLVHRARHRNADTAMVELSAKDRREQEALERLHQETEAMKKRLRIVEDRQDIQRRIADAD